MLEPEIKLESLITLSTWAGKFQNFMSNLRAMASHSKLYSICLFTCFTLYWSKASIEYFLAVVVANLAKRM